MTDFCVAMQFWSTHCRIGFDRRFLQIRSSAAVVDGGRCVV